MLFRSVDAVEEKKRAGKIWRNAKKDGYPTETARTEKEFRNKQKELSMAVGKEEKNRYEKLSRQILQGPRNERAKRFWSYVTSHNQQNSEPTPIRTQDGNDIHVSDLREHLTIVG